MLSVLVVLACMWACTLSVACYSADRVALDPWLDWTVAERETLRSLSIGSLPPLPASPGNPVADDPSAVALGHRLFFDTRLSQNSRISCASCHQPAKGFKDGLARGVALGQTQRKTMSLLGVAYSPWLFWDGRRDSLWSQALEPFEDASEHGGTRVFYLRMLAENDEYRSAYEQLFEPLPDSSVLKRFPRNAGPYGTPAEQAAWQSMSRSDRHTASVVFANIGRALEAYQRRLVPAAGPFDKFVESVFTHNGERALAAMEADQVAGLRLFIGKAQCLHCHNGPLFTNHEFHNTGLFPEGELPKDRGRIEGVKRLLSGEFNCLSKFAGTEAGDCEELRFVKQAGVELVGAFRTPSLRNVATHGPYMHTGQFETLRQVLKHYNLARPTLISDDLKPLALSDHEIRQLESFLHALVGPLVTPKYLLEPKADD